MKESKVVHVTKRDLRDNLDGIYELYPKRFISNSEVLPYNEKSRNVGCQFDSKRDNGICTCKNLTKPRKKDMKYFTGLPKQIYTYHGSRSYTDVGVGSVKELQRKKVKRVYLPETDDRGVGSEDLTSFIYRRTKQNKGGGYYDHKKTSSKCVGGIVEYNIGCVMSEKLSPIVQTRSGATSPNQPPIYGKNAEIGSNTTRKELVTVTTQVETEFVSKLHEVKDYVNDVSTKHLDSKIAKDVSNTPEVIIEKYKSLDKNVKQIEKAVSSDSLVQHVHNLENSSDDKQSRMSMENKLEMEYRKIFSTIENDKKRSIDKPIPDLKSASMLRRRFEALRRGLSNKQDSMKNAVIVDKTSSQMSVPSRRDVSIVSDPPSLEGRSYSNTKTNSSLHFHAEYDKAIYKPPSSQRKLFSCKKERESSQWSRLEEEGSEFQGVKGMFKLWGKKFNLEEQSYKKKPDPIPSLDQLRKFEKSPEPIKNTVKFRTKDKKDGKKFFFFKKKSKDKTKEPYRPNKGVTAGRCEVRDGLTIKFGGSTFIPDEKKEIHKSEDLIQKPWLEKYLTRATESKNSVQVRWNNKIYSTSSSTVFELMDNVYKETGIVFRSTSEITTAESSYYKSYTQHVNFAHQEIEAWMIPKIVTDRPKNLPMEINNKYNDNIEVGISDQKWYIDKSKAFSHKIELVLHSKNVVKPNRLSSSEYLRIDIPKGFFIDSRSDDRKENQISSDEQVYKIVEYENETELKNTNNEQKNDLKNIDHTSNEIEVIVSVRDSKDFESKTLLRDAVIQGSIVNVPKGCDVIGVGIITQSNLRETRKPIIKIQDLSHEESEQELHQNPHKCEFAESFLQDYYRRHWSSLGIDLFSWCVSDSHLRCSSENSCVSFNNHGSRSCPNIYDDFQASTIVSTNDPCRPCHLCNSPIDVEEEDEKPDGSFTSKLFNKLKSKNKPGPHDCCKRVLPKDSLEVFIKRKIYAASNKSKWARPSYGAERPPSIPSTDDTKCKNTMVECPKPNKTCFKPFEGKQKKTCKKHVAMPDCETISKILSKQLSDKPPDGILAFKGSSGCNTCHKQSDSMFAKHAKVDPKLSGEIPQPPCINECKKDPKAPCGSSSSSLEPSTICLNKPEKKLSRQQPKCSLSPPCEPKLPSLPVPLCLKPTQKHYFPTSSPKPSPNFSSTKTPPCRIPLLLSTPSSPDKKTCPSKPEPRKQQHHSPPSSAGIPSPTCGKKCSPAKKPSPLCPHFPPCKKTQSTQISPQSGSSQNSPCVTSPLSPNAKNTNPKVTTTCNVPPCNMRKKEKKKPSPTRCNTSPCRKPSPPPPDEPSKEIPWPKNNQVSNQPSMDSVASSPPPKKCKDPNQCIKKCPLSPNYSSHTPAPKVKKDKDCKPDCANRQKQASPLPPLKPCPPPPPPTICPPPPPKPGATKSKISGLFLKMKPSKKKTCAEECLAWKEQEHEGVIRLNSQEKISIRLKEQTPSTEEIRECMNIKIRNEDGQTLIERKDYKKESGKHRPSVLRDMYKTSNINRVSTPMVVKNIQTTQETNHEDYIEEKSDTSIANLIEIQFNLRMTQGDKATEINIANDGNNKDEKQTKKNKLSPPPQEVFVVKEKEEHLNEEMLRPKNDVNIKIVIKNYKHKSDRKENEKYDDAFSKNISDKFHTVSTGYSDVCAEQNPENVFSVHRATIDLTSSTEKTKTQSKLSQELTSEELIEQNPTNLMTFSHSTVLSYRSEVKTEDEKVQTLKIDMYDDKVVSTDTDDILDTNVSNFESTPENTGKPTKEEKKELLKKVFEKANAMKTKNKDRMKQLRDMLKVILTSDSSSHEEIAVTSNELVKDVTYASLKPNYFRDTDSMNNYYKIDSIASSINENRRKRYPTEEKNSACSNSDDTSSDHGTAHSCMCSALAERLNINNIGEGRCCCRSTKRNEETNCDLRHDDDHLSLNFKTAELVDVETQKSKYLSSKINSTNVSIHSRKKSSFIRNHSAVVAHVEEVTKKFVDKEEIRKCNLKNTFSTHKNHIGECEMRKLNRNAILTISDEDKVVLLNATATEVSADVNKKGNECIVKRKNKGNPKNLISAADILQSYETKKAVLEIYAEKTISNDDEHLVARLPKFVYEKESEIRTNYNHITNYRSVCKKNIVMMAIQR